MMKTLVIAAALAAVVATPALAQTAQRRAAPQLYPSEYDRTVGRTEQPRAATGNSVYDNNQYLGADPDPNVRLDLRRDYEGRDF
jgi:opacity protein-like surface antigen